jgi:hypothetical protein
MVRPAQSNDVVALAGSRGRSGLLRLPTRARKALLALERYLTFTLSEPTDEHTCQSAAPNPYRVGSEAAPLTDGEDVVGCSIHEAEKDSWFSGAVSAEFDCTLLADPTYPTSGCGLRGSVNFENCDLP